MTRLPTLLALVAALALAACGEKPEPDPGSSSQAGSPAREIPGGADAADVRVIEEWASALAGGDVEAAADSFALPSVAENGPVLLRIRDRADALRFNESLPCGARLVRAAPEGRFVVATFELTERPGPGECGPGAGETAQTAFVIADDKFVEWRRVGAGGGEQAPGRST